MSTMMWEAIAANKQRSALLIVSLATLLALMGLAIGFLLGGRPQSAYFGAFVGLCVWGVLLLVNAMGGESVLLASANAREVSHDDAPQLYNVVEEMRIAASLPALPRVFIIDTPVPNAFAVGLKPERACVAVTTGLLERLERDELQGVIAHELGHISNRDTLFMTLAGVTLGAIVLLADFGMRMLFWGGGGRRRSSSGKGGGGAAILMIAALVLAILAPLVARLLTSPARASANISPMPPPRSSRATPPDSRMRCARSRCSRTRNKFPSTASSRRCTPSIRSPPPARSPSSARTRPRPSASGGCWKCRAPPDRPTPPDRRRPPCGSAPLAVFHGVEKSFPRDV
jgi:Zn-dependent protease with chaperone function